MLLPPRLRGRLRNLRRDDFSHAISDVARLFHRFRHHGDVHATSLSRKGHDARASTVGHLFGGPTGYLTVGYLVTRSRHVVFDDLLWTYRDVHIQIAWAPAGLQTTVIASSRYRPATTLLKIPGDLIALFGGEQIARNDVFQATTRLA